MRIRSRQLHPEGQPDGDYAVHIAGGRVHWGAIPVAGLQSLTVEPPLLIDLTSPANPIVSMAKPIFIDISGQHYPLLDSNGDQIYLEV